MLAVSMFFFWIPLSCLSVLLPCKQKNWGDIISVRNENWVVERDALTHRDSFGNYLIRSDLQVHLESLVHQKASSCIERLWSEGLGQIYLSLLSRHTPVPCHTWGHGPYTCWQTEQSLIEKGLEGLEQSAYREYFCFVGMWSFLLKTYPLCRTHT